MICNIFTTTSELCIIFIKIYLIKICTLQLPRLWFVILGGSYAKAASHSALLWSWTSDSNHKEFILEIFPYFEINFGCICKFFAAQFNPVMVDTGEAVVKNPDPSKNATHQDREPVKLSSRELSCHSIFFWKDWLWILRDYQRNIKCILVF